MPNYFNSENIKIFPLENRDPKFNYNHDMFSEKNITNIICDIVDNDNYVTDYPDYYESDEQIVPVISLRKETNNYFLTIHKNIFIIRGYQFNLIEDKEISLGSINEPYYIYLEANIENKTSKITIAQTQQEISFVDKELIGSDFYDAFGLPPVFDDESIPDEFKYQGLSIRVEKSQLSLTNNNLLYLGKIKPDGSCESINKTSKFILNNKPFKSSKTWQGYTNQEVSSVETSLEDWLNNNLIFDDGRL